MGSSNLIGIYSVRGRCIRFLLSSAEKYLRRAGWLFVYSHGGFQAAKEGLLDPIFEITLSI